MQSLQRLLHAGINNPVEEAVYLIVRPVEANGFLYIPILPNQLRE
jgi:hypothetical protein